MTDIAAYRDLIAPLRTAMRDGADVRAAMADLVAPDAVIHMCHPFGDLRGDRLYEQVFAPLYAAMPDLERRDWIVMSGADDDGAIWVGCGGHYVGSFTSPFLDIPPTGQLAHMRFHEFYRIENNQVVEVQAIWDIPELMMQAGAWPMVPSMGREFCVTGPMTQDGLRTGQSDPTENDASKQHVLDMLAHLMRHPKQPAEAMELPRFWHEKMIWYGPAGIGTARGIAGFRNLHQIPFLRAMPDRGQHEDEVSYHFFADGAYVGVTGWPDMMQTITGDGWLGIAPAGQKVALRSLDFWRLENGKIRENWVLVDLLHVYDQIGVDVLDRMRALTNPFSMSKQTPPGGPL